MADQNTIEGAAAQRAGLFAAGALGDVWAIADSKAPAVVQRLAEFDPVQARRWQDELRAYLPMEVVEGVAVIEIRGVLTRSADAYRYWLDGTSSEEIKQCVELASVKDAVRSILLKVSSPGGFADGIRQTADAIYKARSRKPVIAAVRGMAASAAYFLASQASKFWAEPMSLVGSIGVRATVYDYADAFQKAGVKTHSIDTGAYKSAGVLGTALTDEQRAHYQQLVDRSFADFLSAVIRGRGIDRKALLKIADGRLFVADEAARLGLVDGVREFDDVLAELTSGKAGSSPGGATASSHPATDNTAPIAAGSASPPIEIVYPPDAQKRAVEARRVEARNEAQRRAELASQRQAAAPPATDTAAAEKQADEAANREWQAAIAVKRRKGLTYPRAVSAVVAENPDLHRRFLLASNRGRPRAAAQLES